VLILTEARSHLERYAGARNDFTERLNLVIERYVKDGNYRGTKQLVAFTAYRDVDSHAVVTLPRKYNTILAGAFDRTTPSGVAGRPLSVRNAWHGYLSGSAGIQLCTDGFTELPNRVCTFADWTTPRLLRAKFEQTEIADKLIIRGTLAGETIYSQDGEDWIEGVSLPYTGTGAATTTQLIDLPPYAFIKPITTGRVSLYAVDPLDTLPNSGTLVAVYDPTERIPAWKRFRVDIGPTFDISTLPTCGQYVAQCKKEFLLAYDDNDQLAIENLGALRMGLEALTKEDAGDFVRANQLWADGRVILAKESADDTGAGAQGKVQIEDDFDMAGVGAPHWGGYYGR
jgi:hypothetical protein